MSSFRQQVSSSIRILGWNRDASARATHLKAADGNVPFATIERKSMSTKTSIKRVALVAAAALTIGGFSAVSAHAAANASLQFYKGDGAAASPYTTGAGVAGPANTVQVKLIPLSGKDELVTISGSTFASADTTTAVIASNGLSVSRASTAVGNAILTIPTPTVGSITVNLYTGSSGIYGTTVAESVVITVNATGSSAIYSAAKSTVFLAAGETSTPVSTDATITKASTAAAAGDTQTTAAGTIQVSYVDGLGAPMPVESLTATISSGPGTISSVNNTDSTTVLDTGSAKIVNVVNQYSVTVNSSAAGWANFVVWPNGQTGTTTVTIKNSAGTVLGTKTLLFTGTTVASLTAVQKKAFIQGDTAAESKYVVALTLKDSSGNLIVGKSYAPTVTYSTTSKTVTATEDTTTSDANGQVWYGFTPGAAATYGSVTATFTDPTTSTITQSITFTLSSGQISSLKITSPDVNAGDNITYTVTAADANGYAIPDGTAVSSYLASSGATAGTAGISNFVTTGTFTGGVATITSSGAIVPTSTATATFTLEGTAATKDAYLTAALAGTSVPVTFAVAGSADAAAATDAANAATDAANAAADAADNATQAASEALAAVNSLATTVASLIAGIKAQITSLTNLITKIKNKVGA